MTGHYLITNDDLHNIEYGLNYMCSGENLPSKVPYDMYHWLYDGKYFKGGIPGMEHGFHFSIPFKAMNIIVFDRR